MTNASVIPTKTTDLRKFAAQMGIKGMSSANKETLLTAINAELDKAEAEAPKPTKTRTAKANGICAVCKIAKINSKTQGADSTMCTVCFDEAGTENLHQDGAHEDATDLGCSMCFPVTVPQGPRTTTSYRFMVAALRRGWSVTIDGSSSDFKVSAVKDGIQIVLAWRDGAFQYYSKESFRQTGEKRALLLNASQAHKFL